MPEPSAPVQAPAPSESAQTQALIQQIAAEARASGNALTFDPDAPPEGDEGLAPAKPGKGKTPPKKAPVKAADTTRESSDDAENDEAETEASSEAENEAENEAEDSDAEAEKAPGEIDAEALAAALSAEGGIDGAALAKALGRDVDDLVTALGGSPSAAKVARIEKRKARQTMERAEALATKLQADFGDQVAARKAAAAGDLNPAIEFVENTFGMGWNDLNKMVAQLLQGKPVAGLEDKRKLRELERREQERAKQEHETQAAAQREQQVTDAKKWITSSIKGDKLATPELNQQLREAGLPTITDMVFEELQAGYAKGLTDPKKALERVKAKLTRQARALQGAGVLPKAKAPTKAVAASKPRAAAQTGAAGNGRPMNDKELREAVLREAGLWRT